MLNKNKKGLSAIIVTVLLIGLTIVAVGIVWAVINRTLQGGTENIDIGAKCLDIQIRATAVSCSGGTSTVAGTCTVQISRTGTNADIIGGVKVVAINSTGVRSAVIDSTGDLSVAGGRSVLVATPVGMVSSSINQVESTVYFKDVAGKLQNCPNPNIFTF